MTPLRQRMLEAMQLRGLSPRTCEAYVGAVGGFGATLRRSPDCWTPTEVQRVPVAPAA